MKPKSVFLTIVFYLIFTLNIPHPILAQPLTERQTMRQSVLELKKNSDNEQLREKIILLSLKIYPPIAIPKAYSIHLETAKKTVSAANPTSSDYYTAIAELNQAITEAPWMPEAYFNVAMLYEQYATLEENTGHLQKAISNYKYFLLTKPDAEQEKKANGKIKDLQDEYEHLNKEKESVNKMQEKRTNMRRAWREEYDKALLDGARPSSFFKGVSIHASFRLGVNFPSLPKVLNNNTGTYTTSKDFYGAGLYGGLELWPLYGKYFGLGGFCDGAYGLSGNMKTGTNYLYSNKINYSYGINAFLGSRQVKLIGNYAKTNTSFTVSTFTEAGWDLPSSKVDFGSTRYGGGLRFNFKKKRRDLDLMVLFEKFDFLPANQKLTPVIHLGYINSGRSYLLFEVASNYPAVGEKKYSVENNFKKEGRYINLTFAHSFDFFGRRFANQNW